MKRKERILAVTKISKDKRTTVPDAARKLLEVTCGDRIAWVEVAGEIRIRKS